VLIERSGEPGRGVAYARRDHDYLLNVPAGRMSADPRIPNEFLDYARRREPDVSAEDFLSRALYGDYLAERLLTAQHAAPPHIRLECLRADVRAVRRWQRDTPLRVELDDGNALVADAVVLAVGNAQPARLPQFAAIQQHPGYVADPWRLPSAFAGERVMLIGTGLTMVDIATAAFDRHAVPAVMHAVSRHGLVPPRQSAFRLDALRVDRCAVLLAAAPSTRRIVNPVRALVADAGREGGDWREAVSFVRQIAPTIWQRMPLEGAAPLPAPCAVLLGRTPPPSACREPAPDRLAARRRKAACTRRAAPKAARGRRCNPRRAPAARLERYRGTRRRPRRQLHRTGFRSATARRAAVETVA
jgi:uncharacterized NAD(P)/FAD-binding protein YdhS